MKKSGKAIFQSLEIVRTVGIKLNIFPKNFIAANKIRLYSVNDKKKNYGGLGGYAPIEGKMQPFIVVNLAYNKSIHYVMATIAHELLHIAQSRSKKDVGHNNKFRKDCALFAFALGIPYYLIYSYDAPSEKTCVSYGKKREKWYRSFAERNEKDKAKGGFDFEAALDDCPK